MPQTQSPVAKARLLVKCSATATTDGTYLWKIFYLCQYCHIFILSIYKAVLTWDQTQGPQEDCMWWAGLPGPAQSWKPHKVQFFVKHKMLLTNLAARSPALARSAPTMATGRGPRATTTLAEITPDTQVTATLEGLKLIQMDWNRVRWTDTHVISLQPGRSFKSSHTESAHKIWGRQKNASVWCFGLKTSCYQVNFPEF